MLLDDYEEFTENQKKIKVNSGSLRSHPRVAWMCVDQGRHLPTADDAPRFIRGGAVWACRTVGAMDGAIEPPWMGSRRVLPTHTTPPNPQKTSAGFCR